MIARHAGLYAVLLLTPLAACKQDEPPAPIRPVLSVVAELRSADVLGPFAGSIQPRYSTDYSFRLFGRMVARPVNVGSVVQQGDELASLDPAMQAILVRNARAAVAGAEAQLANARAEEARQHQLAERNVTSQATYDVVLQNRETAAANLMRAQASLRRAEDALSFTMLRADVGGVVTRTHIDAGQVVNAGQKVVTVARPEIREAVIAVPAAIADALATGDRFDITVELEPSVSMKAAGVRSIDPTLDPVTRTRTVYLTLHEPPPFFRLGVTVAVTMSKPVPPRVDLPATALVEKDGKQQVWIVEPATKRVSLREVVVVPRREAGTVAVTSGIAAGERVVTVGVNSLAPGQVVRIAGEVAK